jgi:hypothetical protein
VIRERGLIPVRYPMLCGLKPDIASGPKKLPYPFILQPRSIDLLVQKTTHRLPILLS